MKKMMTLQEVSDRLKTEELVPIQYKTGLAYNTLKNIRDGKGARWDTVLQLSNYFAIQDSPK